MRAPVINDENSLKAVKAHSGYLDTVYAAYRKCIQDYQDGRGVLPYYDYRRKINAAWAAYCEQLK